MNPEDPGARGNIHWFHRALLPDGWADHVAVTVENGAIVDVAAGVDSAGAASRPSTSRPSTAIAGMPNTHCHAFQRAMAGLTEYRQSERDSFWTWREAMYGLAERMTPDCQRDIAAQLYAEMLGAGFTTVAEFHYLHHGPDGTPYGDVSEMSRALVDGAELAGINMTLLPVLYMVSGFDGGALAPGQRRFGNSVESYLRLFERVVARCGRSRQHRAGVGFHSLRAVPPEAIGEVLDYLDDADPAAPIHIHIAEQEREVRDCVEYRDRRPVEWLFDSYPVDGRWCLVHATHVSESEVRQLARSGASVSICPTTEANLGDGIFPLGDYLANGGSRVSIGSDSNVSVSMLEELRWLEYVQRLVTRTRNMVTGPSNPHCGRYLFELCANGGRNATAQRVGRIEKGYRADLLVIDDDGSQIAHLPSDSVLDSVVFSANGSGSRSPFRDVMVGGQWVIRDYRHRDEEAIRSRYDDTVKRLIIG